MKSPPRSLLAPVLGFLARLRYRSLFLLSAALLVINILIPDAIPFVDEILLGIATILLARLRKREDVPDRAELPDPNGEGRRGSGLPGRRRM